MKNLKVKKSTLFSYLFVVLVIAGIVFLLTRHNKVDVLNEQQFSIDPQFEEPNDAPKNNMEEKVSKAGDLLVMNYTGRLENGKVFDSNILPEFGHVTPFEFTLGAGQVIAGWDEGLVGMKIGDKKTLTIPPEKGYGDRAIGNIIPANSTLIFEVELVGIK